MRFRLPFILLSFLIGHAACGHPADQSEMQVKPSPHALEVRFTFNLLTVVKCVRVDADGDQKLSAEELKAAEPAFTRYLNQHLHLEVNGQSAAWGEKARLDYLWPNFAKTPPMPEIEYAARNVDVTFVLPQQALLKDFWIEFAFFEQTGPMQTIRGLYEQDGKIMEVPFSFQEPEYTYDTGFADDPFVLQAEQQAAPPATQHSPAVWSAVSAAVASLMLMVWRARRR